MLRVRLRSGVLKWRNNVSNVDFRCAASDNISFFWKRNQKLIPIGQNLTNEYYLNFLVVSVSYRFTMHVLFEIISGVDTKI
jgi:hypothetical protein